MRKSGILLPVASLPGPFGIGTMGKDAFQFIDFLKAAGQSVWQVLPTGPTDAAHSPYQPSSAFAGNPDLIDFAVLMKEGLLGREELAAFPKRATERVSYSKLAPLRFMLLKKAYGRFLGWEGESYLAFCSQNEFWLEDFAEYRALKSHFGEVPFYAWPSPVRERQTTALAALLPSLKENIRFEKFVQYLFWQQWRALKKYAAENKVEIMGDLPFYLAADSVEVWRHPEWFLLDEERCPAAYAGCPPDAFSETGQLWKTPLYNWPCLEKQGYSFWIQRIRHGLSLFDSLRLDHFRGFDSYWAVPANAPDGRSGTWEKGPGMGLFQAVYAALGKPLPLVAEDLGLLFKSVHRLREEAGLPGMAVLQFAFEPEAKSLYLPHNQTPHTVCYLGTHDNDTAVGWLKTAPKEQLQYAKDYLKLTHQEGYANGLVRAALSTGAELAILPLADYLHLDSKGRINTPGTEEGNWAWRAEKRSLTPALASRIYKQTALYGRVANRVFL